MSMLTTVAAVRSPSLAPPVAVAEQSTAPLSAGVFLSYMAVCEHFIATKTVGVRSRDVTSDADGGGSRDIIKRAQGRERARRTSSAAQAGPWRPRPATAGRKAAPRSGSSRRDQVVANL